MKREDVWWHIAKTDGTYLSRTRFPSEQAAREAMLDSPETYPKATHVPVKVVYTWEV